MAPCTQGAVAEPSPSTKLKTLTKRKLGKVTYIVEASSSESATDTIERKIEKLILRGCGRI